MTIGPWVGSGIRGKGSGSLGRQSGTVAPEVAMLLERLTDPALTHLFIVTLAEPTPVHEAAAHQEDLPVTGVIRPRVTAGRRENAATEAAALRLTGPRREVLAALEALPSLPMA